MIRVQEDPFDAGAELQALKADNVAIGAVYVGLCRTQGPSPAREELTEPEGAPNYRVCPKAT